MPSLHAGVYSAGNRGIRPRAMERDELMKTDQLEKKLQPMASYQLGLTLLVAMFGMPLAMHLLVSFLL
jgi:hypothetical protein